MHICVYMRNESAASHVMIEDFSFLQRFKDVLNRKSVLCIFLLFPLLVFRFTSVNVLCGYRNLASFHNFCRSQRSGWMDGLPGAVF